MAAKEIDGAQVKDELFGQVGVAHDESAELAGVESIDVTHHGYRGAGRRGVANSEGRPAATLQFVRGRGVRAVHPQGAGSGHHKSPQSLGPEAAVI